MGDLPNNSGYYYAIGGVVATCFVINFFLLRELFCVKSLLTVNGPVKSSHNLINSIPISSEIDSFKLNILHCKAMF